MNKNSKIIFSTLNHEHDNNDENILNRQKVSYKLNVKFTVREKFA